MSQDVVEEIERFLRAREAGEPLPAQGWQRQLAESHDAEVLTDAAGARRALDAVRAAVPATWTDVCSLVELRIEVRQASVEELAPLVARIETGAAHAASAGLAARWRYLGAIVKLRLRELADAEVSIVRAIEDIGDAPIRRWMLDTAAQILATRGAFEEARRIWTRLLEEKLRSGDALGAAITASHRAQLEVGLGDVDGAVAYAERGRAIGGPALVSVIRLRLDTIELAARLDAGDVAAARRLAPAIEEALRPDDDPHPYKGAAAIALARLAAHDDARRAQQWLDVAERKYRGNEHLAAVARWRAELAPASERVTLIEKAEAVFARDPWVTEAEIDTELLAARTARELGQPERERTALERAERAAIRSNNPLALRRVDAYAHAFFPDRYRESVLERFTGGTVADHAKTERADSTIIFADLVGFTPRSETLDAEEVMHTVRCLFELSVPVLAAHRVQALSYRGDGLLACARGEGHEARALAFACEFTARAARITKLRVALGDVWGLDVRAGVAAGPAVFGVLGTLAKLEYVVNGFTANFAARLQGAAQPNEVVCDERVGKASNLTAGLEHVTLKGIAQPIPVYRIAVSAL